jgi:hypothetical protein
MANNYHVVFITFAQEFYRSFRGEILWRPSKLYKEGTCKKNQLIKTLFDSILPFFFVSLEHRLTSMGDLLRCELHGTCCLGHLGSD